MVERGNTLHKKGFGMIDRKHIVVTETQPDEMGRVTFKAELRCQAFFTADGPDFADDTRKAIVERLCNNIDDFIYGEARKVARDVFLNTGRLYDYSAYETFSEQKVKLSNALKMKGDIPEPIKLPHTQRILEHFNSKDGHTTPDKKVILPR